MTWNVENAGHSDVVTWLRCPNSFKYKAIWGIQAKRRDTKMNMGTMVHRFLQDHNLGLGIDAAVQEFLAKARDTSFTDEELIAANEQVAQAVTIFHRYLVEWAEDAEFMKVLHVEEEFSLEWEDDNGGPHHRIRVTPDVVFQDTRTGVIWIKDYKTVDSIPDSREVPSYQMLLYIAAVQAAYPEHRVGFVLDYIRRKSPTQPRLNKTGPRKVTNLKAVDTTYELLLQFLEDEAPDLLTDAEHIMRLQELKEASHFFQRDIIFLPEQAIDNALTDAGYALDSMASATHYPRVFINNGAQSCDRCEFKPLCLAELRGEEIDSLLAAFYEERTAKNVYESEEEDATNSGS
jgi:PD-(D/E)XK nuclease superfamily protein